MNRISPVLDRLIGIEDPDGLMTEITEVVSDTAATPQAGQFFLFSYQPSSSGRYDANPLVAIEGVSKDCKDAVESPFNIFSRSRINKLSPL